MLQKKQFYYLYSAFIFAAVLYGFDRLSDSNNSSTASAWFCSHQQQIVKPYIGDAVGSWTQGAKFPKVVIMAAVLPTQGMTPAGFSLSEETQTAPAILQTASINIMREQIHGRRPPIC